MANGSSLRIDQSEGINNDLSFDRLNWIDDNCHCSAVQLLETLWMAMDQSCDQILEGLV